MPKKDKSQGNYWSKLPDRVFISHAYDDGASKDKLLRRLPEHIDPVVFPRRDPDPRKAVSDGIVSEILLCGGLINLASGRSEESLWVNFERDYALRSGLEVFIFDAKAGTLREDPGSPVPLRIELIVDEDDEHRAEALLEWMKSERSFEFQEKPTHVRMKEIPDLVARLIHDQRIVVWLMDKYIGGVARLALEIPTDYLYYSYSRLRYPSEYSVRLHKVDPSDSTARQKN